MICSEIYQKQMTRILYLHRGTQSYLHSYTADLMMLHTWHVINYTLHTAWCVGIRLIVLCPVMCSVCCILLFHHLLLLFQFTTRSPKSAICVVACLIVSCCHLVMSFPQCHVAHVMGQACDVMSLCSLILAWPTMETPKTTTCSICHLEYFVTFSCFYLLFFMEWNLLLLIVKTVFEYAYF